MKNKIKILGIGCASLIGLFTTLFIMGSFLNASTEKLATIEDYQSNNTFLDSIQVKNKDSIAIIKKIKAKRDLKLFKKKEDEFEGYILYRDPRTPNITNENFIYPYISQKKDNYKLRLRFQYAAADWLFISKTILLIDGEKFTITGNWKSDNNTKIWEWLDIYVRNAEHKILEKIAKSKSAKIRYIGNQYHKDRSLTRKEKNIIKKTLEIYNNLK